MRKKNNMKKCKNCNKELTKIQITKKNIFCCKNYATSFRQKAHDPDVSKIEDKDLVFYILGLIWSDGNLTKEEDKISINSNDLDLLQMLYPKFSDTNKRIIYTYKKSNTIINTNNNFIAYCKKYGLCLNKSRIITFPPIPKKYYYSFIRGVFDGDGSVYIQGKYKNNIYLGVTILSANKLFLIPIQNIFLENNIESNIIKDCRGSVYCLKIYKQKSIKNFYNFIYNNTSYYLKRKKEKFSLKI